MQVFSLCCLVPFSARSVNFTDDPILGDPSPSAPCCIWHGDISQQQGLPVLLIQKPNNPAPTSTYVCRVLAFLFADDASLKLLKQVRSTSSFRVRSSRSRCPLVAAGEPCRPLHRKWRGVFKKVLGPGEYRYCSCGCVY